MTIQLGGKELETGVLNGKKLEEVWYGGKKVRPEELALKFFVDPSSSQDLIDKGFHLKKRGDYYYGRIEYDNGYLILWDANDFNERFFQLSVSDKKSAMLRARYKLYTRYTRDARAMKFGCKSNISIKPLWKRDYYLSVMPCSREEEGSKIYTVNPTRQVGIKNFPNQEYRHIILEARFSEGKIFYTGYNDSPFESIESAEKLFSIEVPHAGKVIAMEVPIAVGVYGYRDTALDRVAFYE